MKQVLNRLKYIKLVFFILMLNVLMLFPVFGQVEKLSVEEESNVMSDYYRILSTGVNRPIYRDFATSPLYYNGIGMNLQTSRLKRSSKKERAFDVGFGFSSLSAQIPQSNYLQPDIKSTFMQLNLRYLMLWEIKRFSNVKNNIKLGGNIQTTLNIRPNAGLYNNSLGLENITNIMTTGQIIKDISRKTERKLNLWLFKPTLKPKKMDLRFQINAGILNLNYRPGYAYSYVDELNGLETVAWMFSNYIWSVNGWRFNSELEIIKYLPNGNAKSWSYLWDAASVPGRFESFQMASHQIRFTYYFHTKKDNL